MRKGIIFGSFDLLHVGHAHMFRQARQYCDELIIGLHIDPSIERPEKNKPIESVLERYLKLKSCKYIDQVIVYETEEDISLILKAFRLDVRFLGEDYLKQDSPITAEMDVPITYLESLPIHSSDIRERVKNS